MKIEVSEELTPEVLAIRRFVFIEEQGISEADELDGTDEGCTHWLLREGNQAVATLRTRSDARELKIARVATLPEARGKGYAGALLRAVLADASAKGLACASLGAQCDVVPYYIGHGFEVTGPIYDDAGIPHQDMTLDLAKLKP